MLWTVVLKTLEGPLDCKEIQPVHPKEISPECSLEGLMLKLKPQYFGHLIRNTDSFEKTLMLGKIEGRRRRGQQRMRWLDGITTQWAWVWVNSGSWWWQGGLSYRSPWGCKESNTTERLNWIDDLVTAYDSYGDNHPCLPRTFLHLVSKVPYPWKISVLDKPGWWVTLENYGAYLHLFH